MESFKDAILSGTSDLDLFAQHPGSFLRYTRGLQAVRTAMAGSVRTRPELLVFIGRPGVGKTTRIISELKDASTSGTHYQNNPKWWDGYSGQEDVVLDDFSGWIPRDTFLKLIDVVPIRMEIKGGFTPYFTSKRVFISSNFLPVDWWKDLAPEQVRAVTRRISKMVIWDEDGETQAFESWEEFISQQPDQIEIWRHVLKDGNEEPKLPPVY